jgi:(2R)-3-sulfolactate dehydrogenase (NADP+)
VTATILQTAEIEDLARRALIAAGASAGNAWSLAAGIAAAERDGIASHGLAYLPTYCEHLRCDKVDGTAIPELQRVKPGLLTVDAKTGFAHPAIDLGFAALIPLAREQGIVALAIRNSYNCGVLGYHTERLARAGLLALGFTHAPASIAPIGGLRPVVGTNPFAIAVPDGAGGTAIAIDQSASVVAKSEIMRRNREGRPIPEGWAFGPDGRATTDPAVALKGTMAPSGGYKGVGIALLVELLAAAASGATLSIDASPFSGTAGGPPKTGQFFIAIDAAASSGGAFAARVARLVEAIAAQEGVHLQGSGREAARARADRMGIAVDDATLTKVRGLTGAVG